MKNLPYIIGGIGLAIFGIAGSCDYAENPIIAIPIIIGAALMFTGMHMERSWNFEEKDDFNSADCVGDDTDDGITYILCDSSVNERYMKNKEVKRQTVIEYLREKEKEKVLPPTKVTEPIRENE